MYSVFKMSKITVGDRSANFEHMVDLHGNLNLLLFKLILADQLTDLPPSRSAGGSEWKFLIGLS